MIRGDEQAGGYARIISPAATAVQVWKLKLWSLKNGHLDPPRLRRSRSCDQAERADQAEWGIKFWTGPVGTLRSG